MTDLKPWYLSRTVWASIVTTLVSVGGLLGLPLAGLDTASLTDSLLLLVTGASGIVAIVGRLQATARLK